jgi:cobalt-zinc-cadmium efflux system membrane fusion protein
VQLGQRVAAGTLIVDVQPTLDVPDEIAAGTQAAQRRADIEAAQRQLTKAEADADRARSLSPQVVSAAQLQQSETVLATARARLQGLQAARTAESGARSQPAPVTAPMAGTIAELDVDVGSLVNRGDVLARIIRSGPLWVDISVPPDEPVGDRYEVLNGTATVPARLLSRGRVTNADGTRTDRLAIDADAASGLVTGSLVSVRVGHGTSRGIVIPESALVPGVEYGTVFVETAAGTFASRQVQVDARFGGQVRLASGLNAGDRVVTRGGMALQGELVRTQLRPED